MSCINRLARRVDPLGFFLVGIKFKRANSLALVWRQHGKFNSVFSKVPQSLGIGCRLSEPHSFRKTSEGALVNSNTPADLRDPIATARKRHDHVVVHLRHRGTVAV